MMNPMALTGKTIIVTGAGQGIGRAISELVLGLGGNLVMVERNRETLMQVAEDLAGDHTMAIEGDVLGRNAWPMRWRVSAPCRH